MTDVRGEFGATVSSQTRSVNVPVQPPGYAFKMFRTALPDRPIEVAVEPLGGKLIVETPRFNVQDDNRQPFVLHAGADYEIALAIVAWGARFEEAGDRYRIRTPMMERGQYTLCMLTRAELPRLRVGALPPERCANGFLAPLGELTLSVK